jgi:hypothetical protein
MAPVPRFPRFDYTEEEVKQAGGVIAGTLAWTPETEPEIRQAFQVANNWRDAHAYPMRSVRSQLMYYIRARELTGITAARLKRMQAIRQKLRRPNFSVPLHKLQDLGGCRAILASISDVHSLVDTLRKESRHDVWNEDDYIARPKNTGYRCHHLKFSFRGKGGMKVHDGTRIEVQIRTRLQHSWATAVEAVGLMRGEDLKGGVGSADWLRLFRLMSAEFAIAEGCPETPDLPAHNERVTEIRALDKALSATDTLEKISLTFRWTDSYYSAIERPTHYLIRFDHATKEVSVQPYSMPRKALVSYDNAEALDNKTGEETENIVLVEADKIENLKAAYPNYFGDVQLFKKQLRDVTRGKQATEYVVPPQATVAPRPKENPNYAWLKRRHRWR